MRSLNERVHGRLKSKFRALCFWRGDRQVSAFLQQKPSRLVDAWSMVAILHNVEITIRPMTLDLLIPCEHILPQALFDRSLFQWTHYCPQRALPLGWGPGLLRPLMRIEDRDA